MMPTTQRIQTWIGIVLLYGTLLSTGIVITGGIAYLMQTGGTPFQHELFQVQTTTTVREIWQFAFSFTPLGLIQLGLLLLIATQALRVAMLGVFYAFMKDCKFACISLFIFVVLIYSSFCRS